MRVVTSGSVGNVGTDAGIERRIFKDAKKALFDTLLTNLYMATMIAGKKFAMKKLRNAAKQLRNDPLALTPYEIHALKLHIRATERKLPRRRVELA